jgi:hypothetical protein
MLKGADVCSSLSLAPATVSAIMAKAEKLKHSALKTTNLRAPNVRYTSKFQDGKNGAITNIIG